MSMISKLDDLDCPDHYDDCKYAQSSPNTPEPPPIESNRVSVWELVIEDMKERDKIGREKYKMPLRAYDGRNSLIESYQECLDMAVYLRKAIEEQEEQVLMYRIVTSADTVIKQDIVYLEEAQRVVSFHASKSKLFIQSQVASKWKHVS